jgi:hypothetical protein
MLVILGFKGPRNRPRRPIAECLAGQMWLLTGEECL